MTADAAPNRRILVIDDNEAIHADFRKILCPATAAPTALDAAEAELFGTPDTAPAREGFEIDSAFQGQQGYERVVSGGGERPYAVAFVDMRMPPGWDGVETIEHLWRADPYLQVVICTAYSDFPWDEILRRLGTNDRLLLLKKPFDAAEVWQLAHALSVKWTLTRHAEHKLVELDEMTQQLTKVNRDLKGEVQQRREAESRLRHQVSHDALTGLPNRQHLLQHLGRCIERARRQPDFRYAALFIDLDNFKIVNDSFGHDVGDLLLVDVARRLTASLRALDCVGRIEEDAASRLGGDEFVVVLDGIARPANAAVVAERILQQFATPYELNGHSIVVNASIGITTSEVPYERAEDILRDADTAMYRAKSAGKSQFALFDQSMHAQAMARLRLENDLRRAIDEDQFFLVYHPIVNVANAQLRGFEALIRWQHPTLATVPPDEFIAAAEETGMIVPIGRIVLAKAIRQFAEWHARFPAADKLYMGVNISRRQLFDPKLVELVRALLAETGLSPESLSFEITETAVIQDFAAATRQLQRLKELGVGLQMDDFGTGYSSLSCLHRFPLDVVKIDREFVATMGANPGYATIIQAIVELAHRLGMAVVVEGVETEEQLAQIIALDCDYAQGYYFSRPLDPAAAAEMLKPSVSFARPVPAHV